MVVRDTNGTAQMRRNVIAIVAGVLLAICSASTLAQAPASREAAKVAPAALALRSGRSGGRPHFLSKPEEGVFAITCGGETIVSIAKKGQP